MKTFISTLGLMLLTIGINAQTFDDGRSFLSGNATNLYLASISTSTNISNSTNTFGTTNQYMVNGVWKTNATGFVLVSGFANRDGTPPNANISISLCGTNSTATNLVTFEFRRVANSRSGVTSGGANDTFSFNVTATGTTPVVMSTNVPTTFLQGIKQVELYQIRSTVTPQTNITATVFVNDISLNGYPP